MYREREIQRLALVVYRTIVLARLKFGLSSREFTQNHQRVARNPTVTTRTPKVRNYACVVVSGFFKEDAYEPTLA